jgi:hypothetical protein
MNTDLVIRTVQVSDGNGIIPTVTLVFSTPAGEEKISSASQSGENLYHAIFRGVREVAVVHLPEISRKEIKLLSCGGSSPYKGGCKGYAHIRTGLNGNGQNSKRGGWHANSLHLAIARAILNCFRDIAES